MHQFSLAVVAVAAVLAAASPAAASTTFGADLSVGGAGIDCNSTCASNANLTTTGNSAPDDNYGVISAVTGTNDGSTAAAPLTGVLVSFSVRLSTAHTGRVRIIDPSPNTYGHPAGSVALYGTGDTVSVPGDGATHSYATRLPISAGSLIGFEVQTAGPNGAAFVYRTDYGGSASTNTRMRWFNGTPDGNTGPPEVVLPASLAKDQAPIEGVIEPDADNDYFGDETQDQCPGQKGAYNGCPTPPDADGDGIPDASDACPTQSDASAPRNPRNGCPAAPATDTDGDGVPDSSDACPTQSDLFAQRNPRNGCPAAPADKTPPVISSFALSPTSFVAANSGPPVVAATSVGTHVFYKLSEPATTTFSVERKSAGHKKAGKCVSGRAKHGQKPCTRYTGVGGKIVRGTAAGLSSFRFMGRLNGHSLKPGSYRLVASARDAAGNSSKPQRRSFTIKHA